MAGLGLVGALDQQANKGRRLHRALHHNLLARLNVRAGAHDQTRIALDLRGERLHAGAGVIGGKTTRVHGFH